MPALLENLSSKIQTAKNSGYKENEILDYLGSQGMQDKIKTARDSGYKDTEIIDYLSKTDVPSVRTDRGAAEMPSPAKQDTSISKDILHTIADPISQAKEAAKLLTETIPNIPESALNYLKGIASGIMPKKESYYVPGGEMVRGVANLATGAVQKLIPGEQDKEKVFGAVIEHFKNRYGGVENLRQTMTKDPVGFASDLSTALSLGGGIATKAGQVSGIASLAEKGTKLATMGRTIEPINMAINLSKPVAKVAGSLAAQIHGRFMTGAGAEATKQAFKGDPDFIQTLRGAITDQDIIDNSKNALRVMRKAEVSDYGEKFKTIKEFTKPLDITPVKSIFETDRLKRLSGTTRSSLPSEQIRALDNMKNLINDWSDSTAFGLDSLKQALDDFYKGSKDSRVYDSIVNEVRNSVKSQIVKNIPEYSEMTKKYSKFLHIEEEMNRALSLSDKAMMDTTMRKLLSTMRENFEYRKELVETLDAASGGKLMPQIAGLTMQSYLPKGLVGKLEMGGLGVMAYLHGIDPVLGTALLMSSPRLSGEFLYLLGKTAKGINKGAQATGSKIGTTARQVLTQTEATRNTGENNQ